MVADTNALIIGAGAVGLTTAYALGQQCTDLIVLERNARAGAEISSHNSEVVHAGLYYSPGSLRASLCRDGARRLHEFCSVSGVPFMRCGKLIVAADSADVTKLERLQSNALASGVSDLRLLTREDIKALEPELTGHAALLSPSTAVFDSGAYIDALQGAVGAEGGQIIFRTEVTSILQQPSGVFIITTDSDGVQSTVTCEKLVLCGGLAATKLGRMVTYPGAYQPPSTHFAKGHYYTLAKHAPFQHLIYPLPSDGGLGIHFTRDCAGLSRFGPDIDWCDGPTLDFDDSHERKQRFRSAIHRYWPAIDDHDLVTGYVGVRPKLSRQGAPDRDFAIHTEAHHGIPNLVSCYGIDSPGLTASLAIGEWIAQHFKATSHS